MPLLILYPSHSWFPCIETISTTQRKVRILRQAQTCVKEKLDELRRGYGVLLVCTNLYSFFPRYSKCKLYGKCAQKQTSWPTFFFLNGKSTVRFCLRHVVFGWNELVVILTTGIGNLLFYHLIFLWLANRRGFCQYWPHNVQNCLPLCLGELSYCRWWHSPQPQSEFKAQPQVCSGADLFEQQKVRDL